VPERLLEGVIDVAAQQGRTDSGGKTARVLVDARWLVEEASAIAEDYAKEERA